VALAAIEPVLSQLQQKQWIEWNGDQFSTTDSGYLYLNELLSYWLADDD
jgi:oxygen-independent coproporphyrinogen-3 oxidase